jgi:hypothetical protein
MLIENPENSKHQKSNLKQIPMAKIQNSKIAQWLQRTS